MDDLTEKRYVAFLKEIFSAPEPGTERMMITAGYWWKWTVGRSDSLRVSDNGLEWRTPTDYEIGKARDGRFGTTS